MPKSCDEYEINCSANHRCVFCVQFDSATDRVRQLKAELLEARRIAARLGTLKNNLHASTSRLPAEILSHIMEIFYEHDGDLAGRQTKIFPPLKFGAVSRTWRQTAWATPRIWTAIHFIVESTSNRWKGNITRRIELSKQYVSRSGALPLTIEVECQDEPNFQLEPKRRRYLIDMLLSWASRWHTVRLQLTPDVYRYMNTRLPVSCPSNLQTLYVAIVNPDGNSDEEMNWTLITGGLKKLIFERDCSFSPGVLTVNTAHLEEVECNTSAAGLATYLRTSPKLRIAKIEIRERDEDGDEDALFGEHLVHETLQHLHLNPSDRTNGESILSNLVCPNLESFRSNGITFCKHPHDIPHFLSGSPKIRKLTLTAFQSSTFTVPSLPRLEELTITHSEYDAMSQLIETAFTDGTSPLGELVRGSLQRLQFELNLWSNHNSSSWDFLLAVDAAVANPDGNGINSLVSRLRERRLEVVIILTTWGLQSLPKYPQSEHREAVQRIESAGVDLSISSKAHNGTVENLLTPLETSSA